MTKKKNLIDRLNEIRREKEPARKGVVAVIANKQEIKDALDRGYTLREIHTAMKNSGEMPVEYSSFTRLVKKYVRSEHIGIEKKGDNTKPLIFNPEDYKEDKLI